MKKPKLHYPRFGTARALCDNKIKSLACGPFLSANKKDRCGSCEKLLRKSGSNVDGWIKLAGGEL
jgi:hypothetical protein